jgi:hypothetical protein
MPSFEALVIGFLAGIYLWCIFINRDLKAIRKRLGALRPAPDERSKP